MGDSPSDSDDDLHIDAPKESLLRAIVEFIVDEAGLPGSIAREVHQRLSTEESVRRWRDTANAEDSQRTLIREELSKATTQLLGTLVPLIQSLVDENAPATPTLSPVACVVLCGGPGRRLWPVTRTLPKVLLPLAGETVLERLLRQLERSSLVSSITLSTDPEDDDRYKELKKRLPSKLSQNLHPDIAPDIGSLRALQDVADTIEGDLLIVGGDNIFDASFDFDGLIQAARLHRKDGRAGALGIVDNRTPRHDTGALGQVEVDLHMNVQQLLEKDSKKPTLEYVSTACYLLRREHLDKLGKFCTQHSSEQLGRPPALGDYINWLVTNAELPGLVAYPIQGAWFDMGDVKTYLDASHHCFSASQATIGGGSDNRLMIGKGAQVLGDSTIGPCVHLGPRSVVKNSQVENSVILGGAILENAFVSDALIGPGAEVHGRFTNGVCGSDSNLVGPPAQTRGKSADEPPPRS